MSLDGHSPVPSRLQALTSFKVCSHLFSYAFSCSGLPRGRTGPFQLALLLSKGSRCLLITHKSSDLEEAAHRLVQLRARLSHFTSRLGQVDPHHGRHRPCSSSTIRQAHSSSPRRRVFSIYTSIDMASPSSSTVFASIHPDRRCPRPSSSPLASVRPPDHHQRPVGIQEERGGRARTRAGD